MTLSPSALFTSLTAIVLYAVATQVLWPYLRDVLVYKGVRVGGVWDIFEQQNDERVKVGEIKLNQAGGRIRGHSRRWRTRDGSESKRQFRYKGTISGRQLTLVFEDKNGTGFDTGSYVFIVHSDGTTMVGMATFHGKREAKIVSESRVLVKVPS